MVFPPRPSRRPSITWSGSASSTGWATSNPPPGAPSVSPSTAPWPTTPTATASGYTAPTREASRATSCPTKTPRPTTGICFVWASGARVTTTIEDSGWTGTSAPGFLRDCLGTLFRNSLTVGSLKKINNLFIKDIFHGYCLKRQSLSPSTRPAYRRTSSAPLRRPTAMKGCATGNPGVPPARTGRTDPGMGFRRRTASWSARTGETSC